MGQNDGDFDPCSGSTGLQSRSERFAARSVERARAEEEEGSWGRAGDEVLLVQRHQVVRPISGTTTFSNEIFEWPVKKLTASIYLKWLLRILLVISYCIEKKIIPIQPPTSPAGLNQAGHMIPSSPHLGGGALNQPDSDAGSAGINFDGRRKRLNSEGTISNWCCLLSRVFLAARLLLERRKLERRLLERR